VTNTLPVGQATTVTVKFRGNPVFSSAPTWELILPNGSVLLSGIAFVSPPYSWTVTLTVPSTYVTTTGSDVLVLEVFGPDANGVVRSTESEHTVLDAVDSFTPVGVLAVDGQTIEDYILLDQYNYPDTAFSVSISDYVDASIMAPVTPTLGSIVRVINKTDVPDRFTDPEFKGYLYKFSVPGVSFPALTRYAYQMAISVNSGGVAVASEVHPVYRINGRFISHINNLKMFLDKARLVEIDPTLQWQQDELAQALLEGAQYVNAFPIELTYWTVDDFPLPMTTYLWYAAAVYALNARYMAEGFTAFEFSGLSTSLTIDRRDTITYKIEELKGFLETNLERAKNVAIRTFGRGVIPENTGVPRASNLGHLGLAVSPVNNVVRLTQRNRFRSYYRN